jgi:ankyrin repeat protein
MMSQPVLAMGTTGGGGDDKKPAEKHSLLGADQNGRATKRTRTQDRNKTEEMTVAMVEDKEEKQTALSSASSATPANTSSTDTGKTASRQIITVQRQNPSTDQWYDYMSQIFATQSATDTYALLCSQIKEAQAAEKIPFSDPRSTFNQVLHFAAIAFGKTQPIMETLLLAGVPVDCVDAYHHTALYGAVSYNKVQNVTFLLNAQADPNIADNEGTTPLMINHNPTITALLLQHGANVNACNNRGETALIYAADHKRNRYTLDPSSIGIISVLMRAPKININAQTSTNNATVLHYLAEAGNAAGIYALNPANPLHELIEWGAKNRQGETALHIAARLGKMPTVQALLARGTCPSITDNNNLTASDLANSNGYEKIAELIEQVRARYIPPAA